MNITQRLEAARAKRDVSGRGEGGPVMPPWKHYKPARTNVPSEALILRESA